MWKIWIFWLTLGILIVFTRSQKEVPSDPDETLLSFRHTLYNFRPKSIFGGDEREEPKEATNVPTHDNFDPQGRSDDTLAPSAPLTPHQHQPSPDRNRIYDPSGGRQLPQNFDLDRARSYSTPQSRSYPPPTEFDFGDRARLDRDRPDQRKYYYGTPIAAKATFVPTRVSSNHHQQQKGWNNLNDYGRATATATDDETNFRKMSLDGAGGFFVFTRSSRPQVNVDHEDDLEYAPRPQLHLDRDLEQDTRRQSNFNRGMTPSYNSRPQYPNSRPPSTYNFMKDTPQNPTSYNPNTRQYPSLQNSPDDEEPRPKPRPTSTSKSEHENPDGTNDGINGNGNKNGRGQGRIFEPDGAGITIVIRKNRRGQVGFGVREDNPNKPPENDNDNDNRQDNSDKEPKQLEESKASELSQKPWGALDQQRQQPTNQVQVSQNYTKLTEIGGISEALKFEAKRLKRPVDADIYRYFFY